ncbi:MAG: Arc family DNA-binding protein [Candidatus Omnitrophica bacterium]|nr:Arc family DNA-binding protein [Candidatus Omnitrophota bacterium]
MASLTIKNMPEDLYSALKKSAEENHRSLNSQVIVSLSTAMLPKKISREERLKRVQSLRKGLGPQLFDADDIQTAIDEGRL